MKKQILLFFESTQILDGDEDSSRQLAKGTIENCDGSYIIEYTEPSKEMDGVVSRVFVENEHFVKLVRRGVYTMDFLIEEGGLHSCRYKTPFGEMLLDIRGNRVSANTGEDEGRVFLHYNLEADTQIISENKLEIKYKLANRSENQE